LNQDLVWLEPQTPEEIMTDLIEKHHKKNFYVLLSGGKDSMCTAHYIATNYPDNFKGVVFTNTGIASPVTRKFVIEYCKEAGWPLHMTWARKSYRETVLEHGFPNPKSHRVIMGYLKFHSWYYFMRGMKKDSAFISGVRKKESMVRNKKRFYTKTPIDINATLTFCKPFLYKNGTQLMEYFIKNGLKKSPAYEYFNKSGECWCGCFYNEWELKMLEKYDPFVYGTIKALERDVQKFGTKEAKKFPHWGRSVGAEISEDQTTLGDFDVNEDYCGESCEVEPID
jgi:3'-phosphoadenosine 5'-phosphosulfate sulfotransferase (PAPS reductase)/FAD synthetase